MGVQIDETRGDDEVPRVEHALGVGLGDAPDLRDATVRDRDVAGVARGALSVDDRAALEEEIVPRHENVRRCM